MPCYGRNDSSHPESIHVDYHLASAVSSERCQEHQRASSGLIGTHRSIPEGLLTQLWGALTKQPILFNQRGRSSERIAEFTGPPLVRHGSKGIVAPW